MIRFILVCIVVIGYLILSIPILLVEWIIGKFSPMKKDISSLRIIQAVFRFILWITGAKVTVIGEENVPKDTPVLYIGNHRSYFDILLTYSRCPIRTGYVAKKEMEKIPLLSTWMRYLHCLFLDRKDIKQGLKTILTAIDKVKSGISICIFPEGTRNRNENELDMLPFHEGSFKIATKAKCPIIPIAINNSADIFEAHFPKMKPAKVVVEYGKPIYPDELSKEDKKHIGEYTQNVIREMLDKNKPLTEAYKSKSSVHGMEQTIDMQKKDFHGLVFTNLVDFDALWGHRRNTEGYARELEKFDKNLGIFLANMRDDDLLMITADHGNDPTFKGTDHTKEIVPLLMYSPSMKDGGKLADQETFAVVGSTIAENFGVKMPEGTIGHSLLNSLK